MQATDVAPNRLAVAKEEVKRVIRGLGGSDRMLIAQMDAAVTPLGPMSGDTSELERALDAIKITDARADFPRALRFATDSVRGIENSEIVIVSDGRLGEATDSAGKVKVDPETKLTFVPIGKGTRNVGITAFSVRRYPLDKSRYEVMLEVTNTGPETEDVELSLLGDQTLVDLTKLRLKPGERLPRFYPNLSGASTTLEAKLQPIGGSVDELPADNHAYALLPERRRAKVLVVTPGNTYLEAALLLDEYLDVQVSFTAGVHREDRAGRCEVRRPHLRRCDPGDAAARQCHLSRSAWTRVPREGGGGAQVTRLRQDRAQAPHRALDRARRREHFARAQARGGDRRQGRRRQ